ncbi:DUF3843 family protein [Maribellus maritimus]|uniref:DUF3843 family protein n=1 Tax=Maribellus maritimus TaxID=2870838 RepID=UPI001EEBFDDC|nr:DUF3843 family protein [Maribellus maritimus]MCG6188038.1 DUF3843 family protein [Maribellus maritimus]
MEKDKIYIDDWLTLKPYENQTLTDSYYLKLCNKVKQALLSDKASVVFYSYIEKEDINLLACFLTAWFEDLISDTNIYSTFVKQHKQLYNKPLPFYDCEEYFDDEINPQDLGFLIWYFMNTIQNDKFISPYNEFIEQSTKNVFTVFDEAWEYAPENNVLQRIYTISEDADYYDSRNLIDTLLFKTYLFYPDTLFRLEESEAGIIEENGMDENLMMFLNENRETTLQNSCTRLLGLKGKEWVAGIIGKEHPFHDAYLNISKRIRGFFLYKGQDEKDIFLEHIASGKTFRLTKKSFDHSHNLTEIDTIVFMGIVQWEKEWWFSGVYFQNDFNADLVLKEKNSVESRQAVNFLDHKNEKIVDTLKKQFATFLDFNNGSPIAFMVSDKLMDFNQKYYNYFNDSLNLTEKEIEEARERGRKDGFFEPEKEQETIDFSDVAESGLVFFNEKSGIEIALECNSAFPLPGNPFFDKENSDDHIFRLFMDESISTELAMYCINNCRDKLPFFTEGMGKLYLNDIDFLLRFWKKERYYSEPSITAIGDKN